MYKDLKEKYMINLKEQDDIRKLILNKLNLRIQKTGNRDQKTIDGISDYFNKLEYEKYGYEQLNKQKMIVILEKENIITEEA